MGYCSDVYLEVKKEHKEKLVNFFESKEDFCQPDMIIDGEDTILALWYFVKWYDDNYKDYDIYKMMEDAGISVSDWYFERSGEDYGDFEYEGRMHRSFQHIESVSFAGKRFTRCGIEIVEENLP